MFYVKDRWQDKTYIVYDIHKNISRNTSSNDNELYSNGHQSENIDSVYFLIFNGDSFEYRAMSDFIETDIPEIFKK